MVKHNLDSMRGNLLPPPHRLLFPINSNGSFIYTIPQTGQHISQPLVQHSLTPPCGINPTTMLYHGTTTFSFFIFNITAALKLSHLVSNVIERKRKLFYKIVVLYVPYLIWLIQDNMYQSDVQTGLKEQSWVQLRVTDPAIHSSSVI